VINDSSPRVLALRLAMAAGFPDGNDAVNLVLQEIGPTRGELVQVLLAASDLLDELVGGPGIRSALSIELDEASGPAA